MKSFAFITAIALLVTACGASGSSEPTLAPAPAVSEDSIETAVAIALTEAAPTPTTDIQPTPSRQAVQQPPVATPTVAATTAPSPVPTNAKPAWPTGGVIAVTPTPRPTRVPPPTIINKPIHYENVDLTQYVIDPGEPLWWDGGNIGFYWPWINTYNAYSQNPYFDAKRGGNHSWPGNVCDETINQYLIDTAREFFEAGAIQYIEADLIEGIEASIRYGLASEDLPVIRAQAYAHSEDVTERSRWTKKVFAVRAVIALDYNCGDNGAYLGAYRFIGPVVIQENDGFSERS